VRAANAPIAKAWGTWTQKQHFTGRQASADNAYPELMNRDTWCQTYTWKTPFPGDLKVYLPNQVSGGGPSRRQRPTDISVNSPASNTATAPGHPGAFVVLGRLSPPRTDLSTAKPGRPAAEQVKRASDPASSGPLAGNSPDPPRSRCAARQLTRQACDPRERHHGIHSRRSGGMMWFQPPKENLHAY
jgi:hypothetical protein